MAPTAGPLILLSPAKTLNFDSVLPPSLAKATATDPHYLSEAHDLAASLGGLSKAELGKLMSLSDNLASLNHERYSDFTSQPTRIAAGAFEGPAYKGLDAGSLGETELAYLQGSLRILCGLYGVIRPLDEIRPYRLEMSTRFKHGTDANLYAKWRETLTARLNEELDAMPDGPSKFVVNAASQATVSPPAPPPLHVPAAAPTPPCVAGVRQGDRLRRAARARGDDGLPRAIGAREDGAWRARALLRHRRRALARAAARLLRRRDQRRVALRCGRELRGDARLQAQRGRRGAGKGGGGWGEARHEAARVGG